MAAFAEMAVAICAHTWSMPVRTLRFLKPLGTLSGEADDSLEQDGCHVLLSIFQVKFEFALPDFSWSIGDADAGKIGEVS